jgi:hypothetical protein
VYVFVVVGLLASAIATAGGASGSPRKCSTTRIERIDRKELLAHYRNSMRAVKQADQDLREATDEEAGKYARQTTVAGWSQDEFGDPMYAKYGPRAYAGTPWYDGPAYTASFERPYPASYQPDSMARGPYRMVPSNPVVGTRSDLRLSTGATFSYMQSGMISNTGSIAPSHVRPMIGNR